MITIVMAYYDNPNMLARQMQEWQNYPAGVARIIVVDDCSPRCPAASVVGHGHGVDIEVYRVEVDRPWGQDAARNIGMHCTRTAWSLLTDMDHVLTRGWVMAAHMFAQRCPRGSYYMPRRVRTTGAEYHPHPNSFLFHRQDFWNMGGYDEDFVGFYGSDGNFRKCAKGAGLSEVIIREFALVMYGSTDIDDARTTTLTRKEGEYWAARNPMLNAKRMGPAYKAVNPLRVAYRRVL